MVMVTVILCHLGTCIYIHLVKWAEVFEGLLWASTLTVSLVKKKDISNLAGNQFKKETQNKTKQNSRYNTREPRVVRVALACSPNAVHNTSE